MKKIGNITVVEGNPNEVQDEILLQKNHKTGKVILLKRNAKGNMVSIMDYSNITANPNIELSALSSTDPLGNAFIYISNAVGENIAVTHLLLSALSTVMLYLPYKSDSVNKGSNKINVAGWKDETGFVIYYNSSVIKVVNGEGDTVTITKTTF